MSAIAGILNFDGGPVDQRQIERLANALPDFAGRPATIARHGPIGLAHRLCPITFEDRFDRQPWIGAGGLYRLVFAGSLDNREELSAILGIAADRLSAMPDSALVLAALERWGTEAPARLLGGFAFAFWDERHRRLQLCRDRSGVRALFLYRGKGFLAFASTINALLALPQVPREMDAVVIADLLALNSAEVARTVYLGIERLPSGSYALCTEDKVTIREYWNPEPRPLRLRHYEEYVEAAREVLERCVTSALRSEKPVAASVSGGLDSSGVAATAARILNPRTLATYTRVPAPGFARAETDRSYFDERPKVEALARLHANMKVDFVDDAGPHIFDSDPRRAAAAFGVPMIGVVNFGWFAALYDRVAKNGHRVLVGGGGGNATLGWHAPRYLESFVRQGQIGTAISGAAVLRRATGLSWLSILRRKILAPLEPASLRRARRRLQGRGVGLEHNGFIDSDFARNHRIVERIAADSFWSDDLIGADTFTRRVRGVVRNNEIGRDRRAAMLELFGFELRSPLLDPRMIEFALNVPDGQFLHDGVLRSLQRDAIADRVPPEITENTKLGAQAPEWFDRVNPQRETILNDIDRIARSPLASSMIDMKRLRRATENWPSNAVEAEARRGEISRGLMRAIAIGRFICWFEGGNV